MLNRTTGEEISIQYAKELIQLITTAVETNQSWYDRNWKHARFSKWKQENRVHHALNSNSKFVRNQVKEGLGE